MSSVILRSQVKCVSRILWSLHHLTWHPCRRNDQSYLFEFGQTMTLCIPVFLNLLSDRMPLLERYSINFCSLSKLTHLSGFIHQKFSKQELCRKLVRVIIGLTWDQTGWVPSMSLFLISQDSKFLPKCCQVMSWVGDVFIHSSPMFGKTMLREGAR